MKFIVNEPVRLLDFLVEKLKLATVTKARNLLKDGSVELDGRAVVKGDQTLQKGQILQIKKPDRSKKQSKVAPYDILLNDDSLIVAVKPSGLLSVNRDNGNSPTFIGKLGEFLGQRLFIVHRLDREVSGLMIFAKSLGIAKALEENWSENEKIYMAIVEGEPQKQQGTIESWLMENAALKVYSAETSTGARHAVTHYRVLKKVKNYTLVEVRLETGRKHQIRVHLSDLGCPIAGDKKYGARTDPYKRIALHATRLSFKHPVTGQRVAFESPFPLRLAI